MRTVTAGSRTLATGKLMLPAKNPSYPPFHSALCFGYFLPLYITDLFYLGLIHLQPTFLIPSLSPPMSERGSFRGGRGRGGRQPQQKGGGGGGAQEKPKKENILDLSKYMDKEVQVKFNGGREGIFLSLPDLFDIV